MSRQDPASAQAQAKEENFSFDEAAFKEQFTKARVNLIQKYPFWGQLALYLRLRIDWSIPTTAVNLAGDFLYNPRHVATLSQSDLEYEIAHELGHLFTRTITRFPQGGNFPCWNYASDIVIDTLTMDSGLARSKISKKAIDDKKIKKYRGKITEEVYKDLLKNMPPMACACGGPQGKPGGNKSGQGQGQGQDKDEEGQGQPGADGSNNDGDDSQSPGGGQGNCNCPCHGGNQCTSKVHPDNVRQCTSATEVGKEQEKQDEHIMNWKQRALGAAAQAKSRGKLPGALEDFLASLLAPKVHWKDILRQFVSRTMKGKRTWARRSRRSFSIGIYLPGKDPNLPRAVIAMDTSGSIGNDELHRFLSEAVEIIGVTGGKIRLILFDTHVYFDKDVESFDLSKLRVQRGGTDFDPVFDLVREDPPNLFIVFTDLYAPYPQDEPGCPVIWAHTKDHNTTMPHFGHPILVED
jgi:predicted metal-dependent peptidase